MKLTKLTQLAELAELLAESAGIESKMTAIAKALTPHDGMCVDNIDVSEHDVMFTVSADFAEHHPSMLGFQRNIKPEFSRIGFEKDPFEGRTYQLIPSRTLSTDEVASIKSALKKFT